jgi:hypothetical protein
MQLQIYRARVIEVVSHLSDGTPLDIAMAFTPLLAQPLVIKYSSVAWVANLADVVFDLSPYLISAGPGGAELLNYQDAVPRSLPGFYFVIRPVNGAAGQLEWRKDTASSRDVAGIGHFEWRDWAQQPAVNLWRLTTQAYAPMFKLEVESYAATSQIIYAIDLGAAPAAASTGRIVFERSTPGDSSAVLALSTAGSGGPFTAVKHGDVVAVRQQTYHLRVTLTASTAVRQTPRVSQVGIEFRTPVDLSAEATIEPLSHAIDVPFCRAAIGDGRVTVVRTGARDYHDPATELAVSSPASKLQLDHYLGSRAALAPREKWLLIDRATVNDRNPGDSVETFTLLSPLRALKRKIPTRVETISQLVTVIGVPTAGAVQVTPNLQGAVGSGSYNGLGYYMRVRSGTQTGVSAGYVQTIDTNTNLDTLNFTAPNLPGVPAVGDVLEVHSGSSRSHCCPTSTRIPPTCGGTSSPCGSRCHRSASVSAPPAPRADRVCRPKSPIARPATPRRRPSSR